MFRPRVRAKGKVILKEVFGYRACGFGRECNISQSCQWCSQAQLAWTLYLFISVTKLFLIFFAEWKIEEYSLIECSLKTKVEVLTFKTVKPRYRWAKNLGCTYDELASLQAKFSRLVVFLRLDTLRDLRPSVGLVFKIASSRQCL